MDRRSFVENVAAGAAITAAPRGMRLRREPPPAFPLEEIPVATLQEWLTSGRWTARRLVDQYILRIAALDQHGPRLGHVLQVNPDARAVADQLDGERRAGHVRGPLHGIPVLIKDNIATADQMETTAGSLALLGVKPPKDSGVARKLREAGAVILGKTNLSEWANFRSSRSTSGWSARGGQCHNPNALDRQPSGSSSGSAVAAAASSCAVAIGTETSGSIVSPSSACGCVGIKPTVGLVSRAGIIPISHSQDTAGPIARTVADAAALLTAIAGSDPDDAATAEADQRKEDYSRALDADGLRGLRIGVLRPAPAGAGGGGFGGGGLDVRIQALYDAAVAVLRQRGADVVDPTTLTVQLQNGGELLQYEFKADMEKYLAEWAPGASVHNLDDLVAFNTREAARELKYFGQEQFEASARRGPLSSPEYTALKERLQSGARGGIDSVMTTNRLDVIVAVTSSPSRPIDLVNGDSGGGGSGPGVTGIAATAGYPHITVPLGYIRGLPMGLSFLGRAWSESVLVKAAFAYEQASRMRHKPTYAPGPEL